MKHLLSILTLLFLSACTMGIKSPSYPQGLQALNTYVNDRITYFPDFGGDYWQTPEETLRLGTGDCEDYVFLKASLTGYPQRLHIVQAPNSLHAILEVEVRGRSWYLDNRFPDILTSGEKTWLYGKSLAVGDVWEQLEIKRKQTGTH